MRLYLHRNLIEMESRCRYLFEVEGSLSCRRDLRRDSFGRDTGRRVFVVEESLLGMVFLCEILVGKVGLDQYRHTVGKAVDCMPFFRGPRNRKLQSTEVEVEKGGRLVENMKE